MKTTEGALRSKTSMRRFSDSSRTARDEAPAGRGSDKEDASVDKRAAADPTNTLRRLVPGISSVGCGFSLLFGRALLLVSSSVWNPLTLSSSLQWSTCCCCCFDWRLVCRCVPVVVFVPLYPGDICRKPPQMRLLLPTRDPRFQRLLSRAQANWCRRCFSEGKNDIPDSVRSKTANPANKPEFVMVAVRIQYRSFRWTKFRLLRIAFVKDLSLVYFPSCYGTVARDGLSDHEAKSSMNVECIPIRSCAIRYGDGSVSSDRGQQIATHHETRSKDDDRHSIVTKLVLTDSPISFFTCDE